MTSIREAQARLCEVGPTLRVGHFNHVALVITHDALLLYDRAIARKFGDFLLLWTEHQGYHVHHKDDMTYFRLMSRDESKMDNLKAFAQRVLTRGTDFESLDTDKPEVIV